MPGPIRMLAAAASTAALAACAPTAPADAAPPTNWFAAHCPFTHRAHDDPIVSPGRPGQSHRHDFFGNRETGARSTVATLLRGRTSCRPAADLSAYWTPTLYVGRRAVRPAQAVFYYSAPRGRPVRPYPLGLKVIAGPRRGRWRCEGTGMPGSRFLLACPTGTRLALDLRFPDCWDGRRRDSADHRSHMAYSHAGRCPAAHPVAVPALRYRIVYPTRGGPVALLASGEGDTLHGDFLNAWRPRALARLVARCLRAGRDCPR